MAQFPKTPEREKILQRIPDYAVDMEPEVGTIRVTVGETEVARSSRALRVRETRHDDVLYLPREDVDLSSMTRSEHTTFCPFKGHASYWSATGIENVAWSYEDPYPEVAGLKNYIAFYSDRAQVETV